MKQNQAILLTLAALCAASTSHAATTTTWTGATDTNYGTASNWDNGVPGDGDVAILDNGGDIARTSNLTWGSAGSTFEFNQSSGTFTMSGRLYIGSGAAGSGTLNISGGTFTHHSTHFSLAQNEGSTGTITISNNGSLITTGAQYFDLGAGGDAHLTLQDSASFSVLGGKLFGMSRNYATSTARVTIIGDQVTTDFTGSIDGKYGSTGGTANTWEFQLSASGAVSTIDVDGGLNIADNRLEISNLSGASGNIGDLVLFNYGTGQNGAFSVIVPNGITYDSIDYGYNGGTAIALKNVVLTAIPEPGTYALLAGLLGLSYVMVRRRA